MTVRRYGNTQRLLALPRLIASFGPGGHHLTFALMTALVAHLVVIFLVRFEPSARANPQASQSALEVILVHRRAPAPVKDADYLAQVNQQGEGTAQEAARPTSPLRPSVSAARGGSISSASASVHPLTPASVTTSPRIAIPEVRSATQVVSKVMPVASSPPKQRKKPSEIRNPERSASAAELVASGLEIASLSADLPFGLQGASRHPRSRYISASTREYRYAAYMTAWQLKVERIGNLNYPNDARRRKIYGSLILDVALGADGEVRDIRVVRSSGHKVLDDTAIRIVQLSSPFAPFPPDIRKDTDVLHITRTWQFREGGLSGGL